MLIGRDQNGPFFANATAQYAPEAKQGMAPAHFANVAGTVADDLAIGAEYGVHELDRVQVDFGFWLGIHDEAC